MTFKITQSNSTLHAYKKHSYQIYKPKQGGHNKKILLQVFRSIEVMLSHYARVFVVRVDLHPKEFSCNNKKLSGFLRLYNQKLVKQYGSIIEHLVVREQTNSKQHYHLALLINGAKVRSTNKLLPELKAMWEAYSGGSAVFVENSSYMMARGDKLSINPVIYRLSYFAKTFTKEKNVGATNYLCSRTKYKQSHNEESDNDLLLVDPKLTLTRHQQEMTKCQIYKRGTSRLDDVNENIVAPQIRMCELAKLFRSQWKYILYSFDWITHLGQLVLPTTFYSINQFSFYKALFYRRGNSVLVKPYITDSS